MKDDLSICKMYNTMRDAEQAIEVKEEEMLECPQRPVPCNPTDCNAMHEKVHSTCHISMMNRVSACLVHLPIYSAHFDRGSGKEKQARFVSRSPHFAMPKGETCM